jgi:hypothetical protein
MDKEGDGSWIFILERKRKLMENLKYGDKGKSKAMDGSWIFIGERKSLELSYLRHVIKKRKTKN